MQKSIELENNGNTQLNQSKGTNTNTNTNKFSPLSDIKVRSTSDDEYNNMIQKQQDEVMRILNNHDDTCVNESNFDPSKSSPPNDFMRKLHIRLHKFDNFTS